MSATALLWQYLLSLPAEAYAALAPWHTAAVWLGLAVLSALGLHYLAGYVLRLYRVDGRVSPLLAAPGLPLWAVLVAGLLVAYVVGTGAPGLVAAGMGVAEDGRHRLSGRIGKLLLLPVYGEPQEGASAEPLAREEVERRLRALSAGELRGSYGGGVEPDSGAAAGDPLTATLMAATRRWLSAEERDWPSGLPRPSGAPAGEGDGGAPAFRLAGLVGALLQELPADAALSRKNWEHVAGWRFRRHVLQPQLERWVRYGALGLAGAVALLAVGGLFGLYRLRRWARRRAERRRQAPQPRPPGPLEQVEGP